MKKKSMAALALALTCLPGLVFGQKDLKIQMNGKTVESKPAAFVENNRVLVPLRFVAENLDYFAYTKQRRELELLVRLSAVVVHRNLKTVLGNLILQTSTSTLTQLML